MKPKRKKPEAASAPAPEPRLLNVAQAASYLGSTIWQMRTLAWGRKLPHLRIGQRILFDRADIDRFIESRKVAA